MDSKEWRGTPVPECGAAVKTHLQGCSELLGLGSGAHTGHPSVWPHKPPVNLSSSSLLFIEMGL